MLQVVRVFLWVAVLLVNQSIWAQNNTAFRSQARGSVVTQNQTSEDLDQCFKKVLQKTKLHRIDKEDSLYNCLEIHKSNLTKDSCFKKVNKLNNFVHSAQLHTRLKTICFYEAGSFDTMNSCIKTSSQFELANEHDDALFYCYQSFQETISQTQCIGLANRLIFPLKKDYLKRHCLQN